jgi:signal transduction histidine kinase
MTANDHDGPEVTESREWLVNQVAHALRNPIFAAMVQTESLLLKAGDEEAVSTAAEAVRRQLKRLSDDIDEMLRYGRPLTPIFEKVEISELLTALTARYRAGEKHDAAEVVLAPVDPDLTGNWDRNLVNVILERLLDNALQHTEPPHRIRLAAVAVPDGFVEFSVSDDGAGIPADLMDKIMLPFFPQHLGRPGLGLAVADKFAKALGGRIEISSSEGQGTLARCILPVSPDVSEPV